MEGASKSNKFQDEDSVKTKVLAENTAQGIFNYLEEIENQRDEFQARWIWELIQNAIDSSDKENKIDINVTKDRGTLVFQHNGRPFTREEVTHLIYHGSTKKDVELGKFGTGFLVTHLLSKRVNFSGVRNDGLSFSFFIDRNATSPEQMQEITERVWQEYQASLGNEMKPETTARFEYTIQDGAEGPALAGIDAVSNLAGYVLALNEEINSITVQSGGKIDVYKVERHYKKNDVDVFSINVSHSGSNDESFEILKSENDGVQVSLKVLPSDNGEFMRVESTRSVPKIFIGLPLIGTEEFPYSLIVNSKEFEPTENRNNIYLGGDETPYIKKNKNILLTANKVAQTLFHFLEIEGIAGGHNLVDISFNPNKFKMESSFALEFAKDFIEKIKGYKIMKSRGEIIIPIAGAIIPENTNSNEDLLEEFYKVLEKFEAYSSKLPHHTVLKEWSKILREWDNYGVDLGCRKVTWDDFASFIEARNGLDRLCEKTEEEVDGLDLLNDFFNILLKGGKQNLLDRRIIPNQNGIFCKRSALFKDSGIDEVLKDVSKGLGKDERNELSDKFVVQEVQEFLTQRDEEAVILNVRRMIENFNYDDETYFESNSNFLKWLIKHNLTDRIEGYPVRSAKKDVKLVLSNNRKEKTIAPKEMWDDQIAEFSDIFIQELLVSSSYSGCLNNVEYWKALEKAGFLITNPLYEDTIKVDEDMITLSTSGEKLDDENEHKIDSLILVSIIAHWSWEDKGIYETMRKSKEKTRKFLHFLLKYVVEKDEKWDNFIDVRCVCGNTHKLRNSLWHYRLNSVMWVPTIRGKQEKPNPKNVANVIKDDVGLLRMCRSDKGAKLLNSLGVGVAELTMAIGAKDESLKLQLDTAMSSLFETFMNDPLELKTMAEAVEKDAKFVMDNIKKHLEDTKKINRNQQVGKLVETLLSQALMTEGLIVKRTGVGSDYEVDIEDSTDGNESFEIGQEENVVAYIEVKSTHEKIIKMTYPQAKKAVDDIGRHILAVVELEDFEPTEAIVRKNIRFVEKIGEKIKGPLKSLEDLDQQYYDISEENDGIKIERNNGALRFVVINSAWENGETFDELVRRMKNRIGE